MKTIPRGISICQGAVAFGLLLAIASAPALTSAAPASSVAPVVNTLPPQTHLTPAVSVASPALSTGEDLRDTRQPRQLPTPWLWTVMTAGVITLAALGFAVRWWIYHGKFFVKHPHEIAFQYLEEARRLIDPDYAREYCLEVSRIIRRYIEERFHILAPQSTTEEFLQELTESPEALPASHRLLLGDFLQHCGLARFAGWYYCRPDLEAMHLSAVEFVRQTAVSHPDLDRDRDSADPDKTSMTLLRSRRSGKNHCPFDPKRKNS